MACVLLAGGSLSAGAEDILSVVGKTLATNPELAALESNRLAIDEELEAAKGLRKPKVDLKAATGYVWTDQSKGSGLSGFEGDTYRNQLGASVSVPILDGWKAHYEVERQVNRVDSARHRVADTANSLALQALQAYIEVQRAGAVVEVAEHNLRSHRNLRARVETRVSSGKGAEAELTQADARLAAAEASLEEAQTAYADAAALFVSVVGEPPDSLAPVPSPAATLPGSVAEAIELARAEAPALAAVQPDAAAATAAIGSAEADYYPQVGLEVSANRRIDDNEGFGEQDDFSALLTLKQNVYNGGITTARRREAIHRAAQARNIAGNAGRMVEKEIRLSWLAMRSARSRAAIFRRQVDANHQLMKAYSRQFDLGERSLLDLLDLQNETFVSESAQATEEYTALYQSYRLLAGMGVLVQTLGIALPEEATNEAYLGRNLNVP